MLFRLKHACGTFQQSMDVLLRKTKSAIWSCLFRWHRHFLANARRTYRLCSKFIDVIIRRRVALNQKKCQIFTYSIDYLGHVIRTGRLEISTRKKNAISRLEHPTNVPELRSFLELCNTFCCFVLHFTRVFVSRNKSFVKVNGRLLTD